MAEVREQLREAFAAREQVLGFIANLERLKSDGSITEQQYEVARQEYEERLGSADVEIEQRRGEIAGEIEARRRDLEALNVERGKLDARQKVGEFSEEQYQAADRQLQVRIAGQENEVRELGLLIEAKSSAELGAPVEKPEPVAPSPHPVTPSAEAPARAVVPPWLSRNRLLALIAGVVVVGGVVAAVLLLGPPWERGGGGAQGTAPAVVEVRVPIDVEDAANVGSLHIELSYDWAVLRAVAVEGGPLAGDAMVEYDVDAPGEVVVGMISSEGLSGDGSLLVVIFELREEGDSSVLLDLSNVLAYDLGTLERIPATVVAGSFLAADGSFSAPVLRFR